MKLAIISHTPHYIREGKIVGWGATVREINHLTKLFDEIYHIAPLHDEQAPDSSLEYSSGSTTLVPLKKYGGENLREKLSVITTAAYNLNTITPVLEKVDWVQFRAPTAMGLYVLPFLAVRRNPKRWVKYAGNWIMENPPYSYALQKWMLEKNYLNCKVTINGWWEGQKEHILSFPNPCLDDEELKKASMIAKSKDFTKPLKLCFVGTLTENKGSSLIIDALRDFNDKQSIDEIVFAGGGTLIDEHKKSSAGTGVKMSFPGFMDRQGLEKVYSESHIIILPSKSEGFPKVIAEAAAYGCVPIVSDVSSISQFFGKKSAFLLNDISAAGINSKLSEAINDRTKLKHMSENCVDSAGQFTFSNYMKLLKEKILDV
jgi:glycosyltransferase involved in cell wall biosynthesis